MNFRPIHPVLTMALCAGCVFELPHRGGEPHLPPLLEAGVPLQGSRPAMPDDPFRFKGEVFTDLVQHTDTQVGADMEPDLSPDGQWLAFSSTRHDLEPDIYLKAVNGHGVIRKTFHPAIDCQSAFSPDGSRIAFCSNRHGDFDIFLMSTLGREAPVSLTHGDGDEMHPTWSPDGSKIAYCAFDPRLGDWELRVVDVATGAKTYLGINGLYPEWSPDGKRLAFQRARERGEHWYSIWTVDLASSGSSWQVEASNPMELVAAPSWGAITPSWSRDSRYLVFVTVNRTGASGKDRPWHGKDVWMVAKDGSSLVQLTPPGSAVASPTWGSDDRVYFVSDRNGQKCIWSLKPLLLEGPRPGTP